MTKTMKRIMATRRVLEDGKCLECRIVDIHSSGDHESEPERDISDPTYFIDDVEVEYGSLPSSVARIADQMYWHGPYTEVQPEL